MKIGILTFHSQLNYGGVLQAYAMQMALQEMGHDAVVIDRWLDARNAHLLGPFLNNWKGWIGTLIRGAAGTGEYGRVLRHWHTIRFMRQKLNLTPYHFYEWKDAPKELGVDIILVGSDQVWNGHWGRPRPYLLEGAPSMPAVAYAASFGMRALPEELIPAYRDGFQRFKAISVREAEGIGLVESQGATATHVVDPTLLLEPSIWKTKVKCSTKQKRMLVCYLLAEDVEALYPQLYAFSKAQHCKVKVLVNLYTLPFPKTLSQIIQRVKHMVRNVFSPVKLELAAGPQEFLNAFANATWVLSDSFHAVMFSSIFGKNVRILRPKNEFRQKMFARIEEFAQQAVAEGVLIAEDVPSALASLVEEQPLQFNTDFIARRRAESKAWLEQALSSCATVES